MNISHSLRTNAIRTFVPKIFLIRREKNPRIVYQEKQTMELWQIYTNNFWDSGKCCTKHLNTIDFANERNNIFVQFHRKYLFKPFV